MVWQCDQGFALDRSISSVKGTRALVQHLTDGAWVGLELGLQVLVLPDVEDTVAFAPKESVHLHRPGIGQGSHELRNRR